MRNLRLYNTDAAFKTDELTVNNVDGKDVEVVLPGVSRTKDQRKTYFNPKDKNILYATIRLYHYVKDSTIQAGSPYSSTTVVKYFSGITNEVYINCDMSYNQFYCAEQTKKITLPSSVSSVTFEYIPEKKCLITCTYNVTSTTEPTVLRSSVTPAYAEVDGSAITASQSSYTFDTLGKHVAKFYFSSTGFSYAFKGVKSLTSVHIPDERGITFIPVSAFSECDYLTSVRIPNTVTGLGAYCFYGCYSLTNVTIPQGVTSIGTYAFGYCNGAGSPEKDTYLQSITIPDSVQTIGNYAFFYCTKLRDIVIPNSVTSLGTNVFSNCYSLTGVVLSNSITSLQNNCFYQCTSLVSVDINDNITSIGDKCFALNSSLEEVKFGTGLTSIGASAFSYDRNLKKIESLATTAPTINTVSSFYLDSWTNGKLYYPAGSNYSTWLNTSSSYKGCPGYWGWTGVEI